jgi:hypothetical protein
MNILFEKLIRNPELIDQFTAEDEIFFNSIYDYVEGRLMPLKEQIEKEEQLETYENPICIIIFFPVGIKFNGYSKSLTSKMNHSFDNADNDIAAMYLKMSERLKQLLN